MDNRLISAISFVLFFASTEICIAQQDSLADVFPLSTGNKWIYNFNRQLSYPMGKYAELDTGTIECQIISCVPTDDSTCWTFVQRKTFNQIVYSGYTYKPPVSIKDTNYFEIVEMNGSQHEIYILTHNWWWGSEFFLYSVFPLWKYYDDSWIDSSKFFRYVSVDSTKSFTFSKYNNTAESTTRHLIFRKDTGIIQSTGRAADPNATNWKWNYYLVSFSSSITDVRNPLSNEPLEFYLSQNYPNPFNPTTKIEFQIFKYGLVTLKVFDLLGREVTTLVNKEMRPGKHESVFDGSNLASGVYFYRLQAGNYSAAKKLLFLK